MIPHLTSPFLLSGRLIEKCPIGFNFYLEGLMGLGLGCGDGITGVYDLLKGTSFCLFFKILYRISQQDRVLHCRNRRIKRCIHSHWKGIPGYPGKPVKRVSRNF